MPSATAVMVVTTSPLSHQGWQRRRGTGGAGELKKYVTGSGAGRSKKNRGRIFSMQPVIIHTE